MLFKKEILTLEDHVKESNFVHLGILAYGEEVWQCQMEGKGYGVQKRWIHIKLGDFPKFGREDYGNVVVKMR
jgi:hypothetical protein